MEKKLKKNVEEYNKDILSSGGYLDPNSLSAQFVTTRLIDGFEEIYDFSGKKVLEIGCGDGVKTLKIAELVKNTPGGSILATDPSTEAIKIAKTLVEKSDFKDIVNFEVGSIYDSSIEGKFDCVLLNSVLHHLEDVEEALLQISKYSDTIVFMEPNGYNPILKIIEKVSPYHIAHEEQSFTLSLLKKWFSTINMEFTTVKYIDLVPVFCPDVFARILKFFTPLFESIPLINKIACGRVVIVAKRKIK